MQLDVLNDLTKAKRRKKSVDDWKLATADFGLQ
jgi:hypothetical protein